MYKHTFTFNFKNKTFIEPNGFVFAFAWVGLTGWLGWLGWLAGVACSL